MPRALHRLSLENSKVAIALRLAWLARGEVPDTVHAATFDGRLTGIKSYFVQGNDSTVLAVKVTLLLPPAVDIWISIGTLAA